MYNPNQFAQEIANSDAAPSGTLLALGSHLLVLCQFEAKQNVKGLAYFATCAVKESNNPDYSEGQIVTAMWNYYNPMYKEATNKRVRQFVEAVSGTNDSAMIGKYVEALLTKNAGRGITLKANVIDIYAGKPDKEPFYQPTFSHVLGQSPDTIKEGRLFADRFHTVASAQQTTVQQPQSTMNTHAPQQKATDQNFDLLDL